MSPRNPEAIAWTIEQFRQRNVTVDPTYRARSELATDKELYLVGTSTVIDVTDIYHQLLTDQRPFGIYEESVLRPPWLDASFCYVQDSDGSVVVNHVAFLAIDAYPGERWQPDFAWMERGDAGPGFLQREVEPHTIDWDQVAYIGIHTVWGAVPREHYVAGPLHMNRMAIDADGGLLDLTWVHLQPKVPVSVWDSALSVTLSAVTFLNCRNVTIVEPHRPRAERRRIARHGEHTISEIHVFPRGVSARGRRVEPGLGGTPLTTVRGHVARYGPRWGRGLLFGKYEGEYWIPMHARGDAEHGTVEQTVTLHTEPTS